MFPVTYLYTLKLLQFGDQDGIGSEVLLQHPLGVLCGKDGEIYITDSYNHKVVNTDQVTFKIIKLWHVVYL